MNWNINSILDEFSDILYDKLETDFSLAESNLEDIADDFNYYPEHLVQKSYDKAYNEFYDLKDNKDLYLEHTCSILRFSLLNHQIHDESSLRNFKNYLLNNYKNPVDYKEWIEINIF